MSDITIYGAKAALSALIARYEADIERPTVGAGESKPGARVSEGVLVADGALDLHEVVGCAVDGDVTHG